MPINHRASPGVTQQLLACDSLCLVDSNRLRHAQQTRKCCCQRSYSQYNYLGTTATHADFSGPCKYRATTYPSNPSHKYTLLLTNKSQRSSHVHVSASSFNAAARRWQIIPNTNSPNSGILPSYLNVNSCNPFPHTVDSFTGRCMSGRKGRGRISSLSPQTGQHRPDSGFNQIFIEHMWHVRACWHGRNM